MKKYMLKDVLKYRNELFGISAIWILLFHLQGNIGAIPLPYLPAVINLGNVGVDIFLFLSAIGLHYSFENNSLKTFYIHRIKRVIIPYAILATTYFTIYDFVIVKDGIFEFFLNLTTLNFWLKGDHPTWYVAFVIIVYAVYPLLYKAFSKNKWLSAIGIITVAIVTEIILWKTNSIIFKNGERALSRIPIFILGLLFAEFLEKEITINKKRLTWLFFIVLIFIGIYPVLNLKIPLMFIRYSYILVVFAVIFLWTTIRNFGWFAFLSRPLIKIGGLSFEIYIVHVFLIRFITKTFGWEALNPLIWYIVVIIVTFIISKLLKGLTNSINKKIGEK